MQVARVLRSQIDNSINYIFKTDIGYLEARQVVRGDKLVVYLSSQTGCVQACRMCHLTATGQTKHRNATIQEIELQAETVLSGFSRAITEYWQTGNNTWALDVSRVHFNFMARGEPLLNQNFYDHYAWYDLMYTLKRKLFYLYGLDNMNFQAKTIVSTILPKTLDLDNLMKLAGGNAPSIYWSAYSVDPKFRRKWLPKAMDPNQALMMLKIWQQHHNYNTEVRIHFAFIEGENDSEDSVRELVQTVMDYGIDVDYNIVRYNPPDDNSRESSEEVIERNIQIIKDLSPNSNVKVIPKVGPDVYASCGMFLS